MKNFIYKYLKRFIERHYDIWGTKYEVDLPPEFIITEHALDRIDTRFGCNPAKFHKVTLKAWKSQEYPSQEYLRRAKINHEYGIYKIWMGHIFVFRLRFNKRLGYAQKVLITVYKKNGYQFYH